MSGDPQQDGTDSPGQQLYPQVGYAPVAPTNTMGILATYPP